MNRYAQVNAAGYSYDGNGNLTSDGVNSYVYDPENRLVSKSGGGKTATLTHDPLGRLWQLAGTTEGIVQFLHDGNDVVAEYNSSGAMLRRYAHGLSAGDDPMVWWEGAGIAASAKRFLAADERGSIVALGDQNGNYTQVNSYDEFGVPAATNTGRFQYTGQMWLPDAGLYYYKARMNSPTLGRFMQTDPIGYADGLNMYRYVGNDPVNAVDPTGLCTVTHMWSGNSDNPFMKYKGKFSEGCSGGSSPAGMFGLGAPKPGGANPFFGGNPESGGPEPGTGAGPQKVAKLTPCQLAFARSRLAARGLPTKHLGAVRFREGSSGAGFVAQFALWRGNPAITRGSNVYVASEAWASVTSASNPAGTMWAEVVHTAQYALAPNGNFGSQYASNVIGGVLAGQGGWGGNLLEVTAHRLGAEMAAAWNNGGSESCK